MTKKNTEHKTIEVVALQLVHDYNSRLITYPTFLRRFSLDCAKYSKYRSKNREKYTELVIEALILATTEK